MKLKLSDKQIKRIAQKLSNDQIKKIKGLEPPVHTDEEIGAGEFAGGDQDRYEITVGNIGTVITTNDWEEARECFVEYVNQSKKDWGRASGEDVVFWSDGEPVDEYEGHLSRDPDEDIKP